MDKNIIILNNTFKQISLSSKYTTILDEDDYEYISQWKWHTGNGKYSLYARRSAIKDGKNICIFMHREIARTPLNLKTDHINGNTLDNRKSNLRICTNAENCRNQNKSNNTTSKWKGVSWHKGTTCWQARIKINWKLIHLGIWNTEEEAAKAYDIAALKYHGEFARLNLPYP